jgi:pimeloyl-ACP methyl ester carboxylesterase
METWLRDTEHVFEELGASPAIWVGSSIGAWLMLLLHGRHPEWFTAMCALAPALDWDAEYIMPGLRSGALAVTGTNITRGGAAIASAPLVASMSAHHLGGTSMRLACPLHAIVGGRDEVARGEPVRRFLQATTGARCTAEYFPDADHALAKLAIPAARERFETWLAATMSAGGAR